jgi:hypothetical protein
VVCLGGASQRVFCGERPTETGQLTQSGQDGGRAASRHRFHHPSIARDNVGLRYSMTAPGSYRRKKGLWIFPPVVALERLSRT